jgi:hypothetical protein
MKIDPGTCALLKRLIKDHQHFADFYFGKTDRTYDTIDRAVEIMHRDTAAIYQDILKEAELRNARPKTQGDH